MTERALILSNCSAETKSNDKLRKPAPTPTLIDLSWRNPNGGYVVGQAKNKAIPGKYIGIAGWVKNISAYIWTFVLLAQKIWRILYIVLRNPTKNLMQYQTVHYYSSAKLSPLSSHLLRYEPKLLKYAYLVAKKFNFPPIQFWK